MMIVFVLSLSLLCGAAADKKMEYDKVRIKKMPIAVQCWTFNRFSFFETLKKVEDLGIKYLEAYPGQVLDKKNPGVRFDHTMNDDQAKIVKEKLKEHGITLISYGVVGLENDEASMRKVFDFAKKMRIRTIVTEPVYDDYSLIEKMVKQYNIKVAIHNHPPPTKYALPETVLGHIQGLDGRIGVCADTGHWMRSGVNPLKALKMLKGRIINVHLKDLNAFGDKKAYDVPFGKGKANIQEILAELTLQDYRGYLAVEHENPKELNNPSPSVKKGMEYIKSITYYYDYEEILSYRYGSYSKNGWNHYGPGYFILDENTGILKSQGGMGLFWYSAKKYKDFVLEFEYKTAQENTNSGVFYRVPEMPVSDDYIYHSFEVQIDDTGKGVHKTGGIYDAEPPKVDAFKKTGEWNHCKITLKGKNIEVELNGKPVVDWQMEPRGKVKDFALEGYIGLQNHDSISPVYYRSIFVKEL
jgi:sugar phosphate isomerase/epimerase